jgi:hypothetical protein
MDLVYGSHDHDWLSVHGRLAIMEWRGCSKAGEVIVIAQREREREREEVDRVITNGSTWRWPHNNAQHRRLVVLRWGNSFGHEDERLEPGGCIG